MVDKPLPTDRHPSSPPETAGPPGAGSTLRRGVNDALARARTLWALAALAMVLDLALTGVGLSLGLVERNPVALALIDALGLVAAGVLLKTAVLGFSYTCWVAFPRLFPSAERYRNLLPVAVALPSWVAVGINATLILTVL